MYFKRNFSNEILSTVSVFEAYQKIFIFIRYNPEEVMYYV